MSDQPTPMTVQQRLTGTTGNAVQDGGVRAAAIALVNIFLGLIILSVSLSGQEITLVYAAVNPLFIILFGLYDKLVK